jgi:hypothetical protein
MMNIVVRTVTPYNLVTRYQRFEGTCCLSFQRLSKQEVAPKLRYLSTKLHGVTYQHTEILIFITFITLKLSMERGFCVRHKKVTTFGS